MENSSVDSYGIIKRTVRNVFKNKVSFGVEFDFLINSESDSL